MSRTENVTRFTNASQTPQQVPGVSSHLDPGNHVDVPESQWDELWEDDQDEIETMIDDGVLIATTVHNRRSNSNMTQNPQQDRDVVLALNEFCFVLSRTDGAVYTYVGPHKITLDENKRLVTFDAEDKKFADATMEQAKQIFDVAPEGWYAVVKNPAEGSSRYPKQGQNDNPKLMVGQKVNIPGDVSFARFPGQMVKILPGHHLRSNEYLMCRVYNDVAAKASLEQAVLKPQTDEDGVVTRTAGLSATDMVMGRLIIIKGTDYSFFIPPTGIEVIPEVEHDDGTFVRRAVTLEQLEYCVMLDEGGSKEFVYGPNVVFPTPTQKFLTKGKGTERTRKFKAIELNHLQGIYCKVIAAFTADDGTKHEVGEELFIRGDEEGQRIFEPRPEIAIIKYGDTVKHYAVAIPSGEARYSLDRDTGEISLVRGNKMWLPDPRKEVPIRRVLSSRQVELLYPGNREALEYNATLKSLMGGGSDFVTERAFKDGSSKLLGGAPRGVNLYASSSDAMGAVSDSHVDYEQASSKMVGDEFNRSSKFTRTPSTTLDTKYEGAVTVGIWNNYAVLLVNKTGDRRVVVGPDTVLLDYDESPEMLKLSKGKTKGTEPHVKTVYLRVKQNRVSDTIMVQTADLVDCAVKVIYQLDFEGDDPTKWFDVEDYVKFITDNCRSRLRNAAKKLGIEEFHTNYIDIVRDTIMGTTGEAGRPGRVFPENASRIYEVDVLEMTIGNAEINELLIQAQRDTVRDTLAVRRQYQQLAVAREREQNTRETALLAAETAAQQLAINVKRDQERDAATLESMERKQQREAQDLEGQQAAEEQQRKIMEAVLQYKELAADFEEQENRRKLDINTAETQVSTEAHVAKQMAIQPELVAAIQTLAASGLATTMAKELGVAAYLDGESVFAQMHRVFKGTGFEQYLPSKPSNGSSTPGNLDSPGSTQ